MDSIRVLQNRKDVAQVHMSVKPRLTQAPWVFPSLRTLMLVIQRLSVLSVQTKLEALSKMTTGRFSRPEIAQLL
jgi:hypothetical protein